jgi:hypothetical protein
VDIKWHITLSTVEFKNKEVAEYSRAGDIYSNVKEKEERKKGIRSLTKK